jgi:hypothetical protein
VTVIKKTLVNAALLFLPWTLGAAFAQEGEVPVVPTGEVGTVRNLLYARPFRMEKPYRYEWTAERAEITSGTILVVEVDKEFAKPREIGVPVLYVGTTPAEVTNVGYESGRMIVIVPGAVDLRTTPIFFGSEELPERVDAARGALELEAARAIGIVPFSASTVDAAFALGGEPLAVAGSEEVYRAIADLIDAYSPTETERAEIYRMTPLVR